MNDEILEWRQLAIRPVRPDAPAGDSARYEPAFERLQAEVGKLEGVTGQPVNWKEVSILARGLIEEKSKDLLVSAYLCRALFEERGYTGLLAGLSCMNGMVSTFWESLFPEAKRMRGRINAVSWLSEKVGPAVARKPPQHGEREIIQGCADEIGSIEAFLDEKMGGDNPGLREIRNSIREQLQSLESSVAAQPAAAVTAGDSAVAKSASALEAETQALKRDVSSMEDVSRVLQDAGEMLRRAAFFVQNREPSTPWPYRMIRHLTWLKMEGLPTHQNGETRIPPPPSRLREQYQALTDQKAWVALLNQVESQATEYPFWLDLHRLSCTALSNLGTSYDAARMAVCAEVYALLKRLPDLAELQFSDGIPFADDQTREWMETEVLSSGRETPDRTSKAVTGQEDIDSMAAICNEAFRLMGEGEIKGAIALLQREMSVASSSRKRFLIRLELARLCLKGGLLKAAVAHLELLDQEIKRFSLEEWDPSLSLEALQTLWRSLNLLLKEGGGQQTDVAEQSHAVYMRLCRLDIVAAMEADGRKKSGWGIFQK